MLIRDLIKKIENVYLLESEFDFDNSGANIVSFDNELKNILVCLDITLDTIDYARMNNVNMIISHHPIIFNSIKNINDDILSKKIKLLNKYDISAYSMHTNFDVNIKYGMGKLVKDKIFSKNEISSEDYLDTFKIKFKKFGIGNIVSLKKSLDFDSMVNRIIDNLQIDSEKICYFAKDKNKPIKKVVILPGSGSSDVDKVIEVKPDLFITSEIKHNNIIDLLENDIMYINATHYGLEKHFIEYMKVFIEKIVHNKVFDYYLDYL